ncbi:MAG: NHL repeat-containing protein, partial [Verrucomicrobiota bacterium]
MKSPIFALSFLLLGTAFAEPSNYPVFTSVLGQPNFSSSAPISPTASSLNNPESMAIDPTTGKLFVADYGNHRVLRFSSTAAYQTGAAAEIVLGQIAFNENSSGRSATKFNEPVSVFVDAEGRLWVTDHRNQRILRFDNASSIETGAPANAVIGQPDFDSDVDAGTPATSKFEGPAGIFVTKSGTLWVADEDDHRILRFDNAASLNGEVDADQVVGQPDLSTSVANTERNGLYTPWGIWIDTSGNLYVGDYSNNRVLRFDDIESAG